MRDLARWLTAAMLLGCGHEGTPARAPDAPPPVVSAPSGAAAGPSRGAPEMAPTPYTAEEIQAANRPGTVYRYKVETTGEPAIIRVMEFTSGTSAEAAEVKDQNLDEAGKAKSPPKVLRTSWEELRRHAQFPRAALTVEPGSVEVPAGKYDAMVYTVKAPTGETMRFYFAKSFAGPPVLFYKERGGVRLMTSTLIERKSGG